ncbi:hypothetical protein Trydic_g6142 [Trypoxylus dichotomus]
MVHHHSDADCFRLHCLAPVCLQYTMLQSLAPGSYCCLSGERPAIDTFVTLYGDRVHAAVEEEYLCLARVQAGVPGVRITSSSKASTSVNFGPTLLVVLS